MLLHKPSAVSRDLSCSTAMLITEGELRYASDPLPFKDTNTRNISQGVCYGDSRFRLLLARLTAGTVPQAPAIHAGAKRPHTKGHVRGLSFYTPTFPPVEIEVALSVEIVPAHKVHTS